MIKTWRVTAELFFSANHIESVEVKANSEYKAKMFAKDSFKKKYPYIGEMIFIQKIERIDYH